MIVMFTLARKVHTCSIVRVSLKSLERGEGERGGGVFPSRCVLFLRELRTAVFSIV